MFVVLLLVSSISFADEVYQCESAQGLRTISVIYSVVGEKVPCEVKYESAGGEKVLWTATKEAGYCEARAKEFVAKQEGWGWTCKSLAAQ